MSAEHRARDRARATSVDLQATAEGTAAADARERRQAVWVVAAVLLGLSALPLLVASHPPLVDYPFHIGRIALLAAWQDSSFIQEHYAISSLLLPNLAIDLILPPLVALVGIRLAADLFILLTFGLILTGTICLHRVLHRSRSLWPLVAGAFLYNWILLFGFLNYDFAIGALLWCLAGWIALAERPVALRLVAGCAFAILLLFAHLVAFGLYAVSVAGFELQRAIAAWRDSGRPTFGSLVTGAAQFLLPILIFFGSPTSVIAEGAVTYRWIEKLGSVFVTLTAGSPALDALTAAAVVIGAGLVVGFGRVRLAQRFHLALGLLLLTFLLLPHGIDPGALIDVRVPVAGLFILIAATWVSFRNATAARAFAGLVSVYLLLKLVVVTAEWRAYDAVVGAYVASFDRLAPESTLFFARQSVPHSWAQRMYVDRLRTPAHIASLAALRTDVFVPSLYAAPGEQPIEVRPRYAALKAFQGQQAIDVGSGADLWAAVRTMARLQREASPARPAYLLLLDRASPPLPLPDDVQPIADGDGFRLLEIYRPESGKS